MYSSGLKWIKKSKQKNSFHLLILVVLGLLFILGNKVIVKADSAVVGVTAAPGDSILLLMGGSYNPSPRDRTPSWDSDIASLFLASDFRVISLAAPIGSSLTGKNPVISREIESFLELNQIDAVSLADQRVLNAGVAGLLSTANYLQNQQIHFTGAGLSEEEALQPIYFGKHDQRVAILSLNVRPPAGWAAGNNRFGIASAGSRQLAAALTEVEESADVVIVQLVGTDRISSGELQELARSLIDQGVNVVVGVGRGPLQRAESYGQGLIFYNIGSLANPPGMFSYERESVLLHFTLAAEGRLTVRAIPLWGDSAAVTIAGSYFSYKITKRLGHVNWIIDI